jgi:hypothetical protein
LRPDASEPGSITDGLQLAPTVAIALITMAVGMLGVSGLSIKAFTTDTDCSALGVTEHEQQPISSSAGSKAYRLTQMFCDVPPATSEPEFVKFTNESPMFKLAA